MTPTAQKSPYLCRTVFHQSISQPISNQAHVWQSSSATTEPRSERELDPFLVVEEPSMMQAIHGEPPYGPIQPNTLSHLRADVPGLHLRPANKSEAMIGRRLSQEEAKRLLPKFE